MAKTPLECSSSGQELDVNDSARVNCVGETRRKFLLVGGTALVAALLGISGKAEAKDRSSVELNDMGFSRLSMKESQILTWQQLTTMSWAELEKKLENMDRSEVQKLLQSLLPVADEVNQMSEYDIYNKLKDRQQFDEQGKEFFLRLAKKYRPESLPAIERKLKRKQLTDNDFHYLFIEFKHFVKSQRDITAVLSVIKSWAVRRGYSERNQDDEKYMELHKSLEGFIDFINQD